MTAPESPLPAPDPGPPALPRTLLLAGVALLAVGWGIGLLADQSWFRVVRIVVDLGLAVVVAVPILNLLGIFTLEWERRAWPFVVASGVVLVMLALNVFWRG